MEYWKDSAQQPLFAHVELASLLEVQATSLAQPSHLVAIRPMSMTSVHYVHRLPCVRADHGTVLAFLCYKGEESKVILI